MNAWDFYLRIAYAAASYSPDPSTQIGALLVNADGVISSPSYNDFPSGVLQVPKRWERPTKYQYVLHAEAGAVVHAARDGFRARGSVMVATQAACDRCAVDIIGAGVACLVRHTPPNIPDLDRWHDSVRVGDEMFAEAGIEVISLTDVFDFGIPIRTNGVVWTP